MGCRVEAHEKMGMPRVSSKRTFFPRHLLCIVLWAASLASWSACSDARPLGPEPESLLFLPEETVTTASRYLQPSSEAPGTVMVISEQIIRERGYRDLVDVLKDIPGFDVWNHIGGQAGGSYVIARGLWGNNKVQVLKDGIPLNPASGTHLVYGRHISVQGLKRIEILYGPSSAVYGRDAFAAVINLMTKDVDTDRQLEIQAQAGNNDSLAGYLLLGCRDTKRNAYVQAYGHGYRSSGFDLRKEYQSYRIDDGHGNLTPFYRLDRPFEAPEQDVDLTFKASAGPWKLEGLWFRTRQPNNIQTPYYSGRSQGAKDKAEIETWDLSLNHKGHLTDRMDLKTTVGWQVYELDPTSDYGRYTYDNYIHERSNAWRIEEELVMRDTLAGDLVAGLKIERISAFPYINSRSPFDRGDVYDEFPVSAVRTPGGTLVEIRPIEKFAYWTYGIYGQASRHIFSRLSASIGARYDLNTFSHRNSFTPRAALILHISRSQHLKLSYATAYISPSPYYTYKAWADEDAAYAHLPAFYFGRELEQEKLQSLELSYSAVAGRASLNASAYASRARNMIQEGLTTIPGVTLYYRDGSTVPGAVVEIPGNSGTQDSIGMDVLGRVRIYCNWSSYLCYSYLDARIREGRLHYRAPKVSMHKVGFGLTGVLFNHLGIHLRGRWWSGIYTMPANPLYRGRKLKGHLVLDANIRWLRIFPSTDLSITINNLLDDRYFTAGNESENHSCGASLPMVPQDPRQILVGLTYRF